MPARQECKRYRGDDNLAAPVQQAVRGQRERSTRQGASVLVVQELGQLLAQALVALSLVAPDDGALEQGVLQLLRQVAPEIGRSWVQMRRS